MKRIALTIFLSLILASSLWAAKIEYVYTTGSTIYAVIRNPANGQVWNGSAFEAWNSANIATYDVALSGGTDSSMYYSVDFPVGITAGTYTVAVHLQAGGSPAVSDTLLGAGTMASDGLDQVNVTKINSVATTSVATINANLGTTQPVNYTGTGASAKVKSDVITVEGSDATDALASYSILKAGTVATASSKATFTLSAGFPATANAYPRGTILTFTDATDGQIYISRLHTYSSGRVVVVNPALPVAPEVGDTVVIWPAVWPVLAF